ncbi:unnamed protein product [Linum trigynum]|uniref:Uncharacterized protein n=1 Tax=Linum trigynum TaxID=586398 RepID=A0AAV2D1N6_9ROSI
MKNSNILLLFLLASFVIIGNEAAMATKISTDQSEWICYKGTAKVAGNCVQNTCDSACKVQYGGSATGLCRSQLLCNCYGPCQIN